MTDSVMPDEGVVSQPPIEAGAALQQDDFSRLQTQILELRTANYELQEENKKLKQMSASTAARKPLDDTKALANKLISRAATFGKKDEHQLEDEVTNLRKKLAVQEEEFRLQQMTMRVELEKVMTRSETLESQIANSSVEGSPYCSVASTPADGPASLAKVSQLEVELREANDVIASLQHAKQELTQTQNQLKESNSCLKADLDKTMLSAEVVPKLREEALMLKSQLANSRQELETMTEKYRKKQESYVQLTEEKERAYVEHKQSLETLTMHKDKEIDHAKASVADLNKTVAQNKEICETLSAEKASLVDTVNTLRSSVTSLQEQNDALQLRLQETNSANDVLSAQLEEAKQDVRSIQKEIDDSTTNATKRKELLDEMALHVESLKAEQKAQIDDYVSKAEQQEQLLVAERETTEKHRSNVSKLEHQLAEAKQQCREYQARSNNMENDVTGLKQQLHREMQRADKMVVDHASELKLVREELDAAKSKYESDLAESQQVLYEAQNECEKLKQEVKDKLEALRIADKKHKVMVKELTKQAQQEKTRANNLQEKLRELSSNPEQFSATSTMRHASPASFEEVKSDECKDETKRVPQTNDAGSVCSWHVIPPHNGLVKGRSPSSQHDGNESVCSIEMLETDTVQLIAKVTSLQKEKCDLMEMVRMLEDQKNNMERDLQQKSHMIEQYLIETHHTGVNDAHTAMGSPKLERLPPGIRRMVDLMKIDLSAGDIRDMNGRLQHMLEETLTKNMQLQQDLDQLTKQLALKEAISET